MFPSTAVGTVVGNVPILIDLNLTSSDIAPIAIVPLVVIGEPVILNPTADVTPTEVTVAATGVKPRAELMSVDVNVTAPVLVLNEVTPPWYIGIFNTPVELLYVAAPLVPVVVKLIAERAFVSVY